MISISQAKKNFPADFFGKKQKLSERMKSTDLETKL